MNTLKGHYSKKKFVAIEIVILVIASFFLVVSACAVPFRSVYFSQDVIDTHNYVGFSLLPCQTITGYVIDRGSWENKSAFANSPWFTIYYPRNSVPLSPNPVSYNYAEHRAYFSFTANTSGTYYADVAIPMHSTDRLIDCYYSITLLGIDPLLIIVAVIGIVSILTLINIYFIVPTRATN
jgi:hypothetical protein